MATYPHLEVDTIPSELPTTPSDLTGHDPNRRSLSLAATPSSSTAATAHNPHLDPTVECQLTPPPQTRRRKIQPIYLASYPGSGSALVRTLLHSLTGLHIGRIAIQTHYPHKSGTLSAPPFSHGGIVDANIEGDDGGTSSSSSDRRKALVLIRNPLHALPSLFDHAYELQKHLPVKFQEGYQRAHPLGGEEEARASASIEEWISWRDRMFYSQLEAFGDFVRYWTSNYYGGDRLLIAYENLTSDLGGNGGDGGAGHGVGVEETKRLRHFLEKVEYLETVEEEKVPCIWKVVVKGGMENGGDISFVGDNTVRNGGDDGSTHENDENVWNEDLILEAESSGLRERKTRMTRRLHHERKSPRDAASVNNYNNYNVNINDKNVENAKNVENVENDETIRDRKASHRSLGYYIPHPAQVRTSAGPNQGRPYSPEQLDEMASMLRDLAAEFKERTMVFEMLMRYHNEVAEFALSSNGVGGGNQFGNDLYSLQQQNQQLQQQQQQQQQQQLHSLRMQQPQLDSTTYSGTTTDGRTFHIFQVSIDNTPESVVATNLLIGLFDSSPDMDYAYLVSSPGLYVHQRGATVPISTTVVTKTQIGDLIALYKMFKPQFDEVFFVVTLNDVDKNDNSYQHKSSNNKNKNNINEHDSITRIAEELCEYDNVLCIPSSQFSYSNESELLQLPHSFSRQFTHRFSYFFGIGSTTARIDTVQAEMRLRGMEESFRDLENEDFKILDMKYGVHGGHRKWDGKREGGSSRPLENGQFLDPNLPRRLFYCGYSKVQEDRHYSIYGIILVNTFFPEIEGGAPGNYVGRDLAIRLNEETIKDATPNDFLVYHMHQHCDAEVLLFPGLQLHVNAEYYDVHPQNYMQNPEGLLTTNYIPPNENVFVMGAHEDGPRSIRLPYAVMRWWIMVKGNQAEINQEAVDCFFDHSKKPINTGANFLLYTNSHYIDYREEAALALSKIKPIHVMGKCQGNTSAPPIVYRLQSPQCQPYEEKKRPPSVIVLSKEREERSNNYIAEREFRFVLMMENANSPGYISEKILDAFMAGSIPIYYGTTEVFDIFNKKAFIYYDVGNPSDALNRIQYLENNPDEYKRMLEEPILADGERTIEKYFSFDESIGHGLLKRHVREKLGFPV